MAVHFLTPRITAAMLNGIPLGAGNKGFIHLHTGFPSGEGTGNENQALENFHKSGTFPLVAEGAAYEGRKNSTVIEWPEVRFAETYTYISIWDETDTKFLTSAQILAPVKAAIGDVFRFPVGFIIITIQMAVHEIAADVVGAGTVTVAGVLPTIHAAAADAVAAPLAVASGVRIPGHQKVELSFELAPTRIQYEK